MQKTYTRLRGEPDATRPLTWSAIWRSVASRVRVVDPEIRRLAARNAISRLARLCWPHHEPS